MFSFLGRNGPGFHSKLKIPPNQFPHAFLLRRSFLLCRTSLLPSSPRKELVMIVHRVWYFKAHWHRADPTADLSPGVLRPFFPAFRPSRTLRLDFFLSRQHSFFSYGIFFDLRLFLITNHPFLRYTPPLLSPLLGCPNFPPHVPFS